MKYVYPVILYPDDGKTSVSVPDLPGCHTYGDNLADALFMAKDAIEMWLTHAENEKLTIPVASQTLPLQHGETLTLIAVDTAEYRRINDNRPIRKTITIPAWLNQLAEESNAPYSQILQQGLKNYLKISE
jgi:predicted RNase H-like HicB family nuclease